MRHIDEIQIAGTAILLCGAMFAVSAVAPTGNTVSKAVTNLRKLRKLPLRLSTGRSSG